MLIRVETLQLGCGSCPTTGLQGPLGPLDQLLQHPFPLALPAAPLQSPIRHHQRAIGLGGQRRSGQGLLMEGTGHGNLQLALGQGRSQGPDQFGHQGIGVAAVQPRQGFPQGSGQGLQPARLLLGRGRAAHASPPRFRSSCSSRARGGRSRNTPGTAPVPAPASVAPGTPRRNT